MPEPGVVQPVLVVVPDAAGKAASGRPPFYMATEDMPLLKVTDLAVTRGEGVFETIGAFDGSLVNVQAHLQRLQRSADLLELGPLNLATINDAVHEAVDIHQVVPELAVRVMVTAGDESDRAPFAWVHAREGDPEWIRAREGFGVVTVNRGHSSTEMAASPWLLLSAKSLSYAVNMAATREALRRGAGDALFVTSDGYCLEGPTSTLLVKRGERLLTTPVDAGVLPGTSVEMVFADQAAHGYRCERKLMTVNEVLESDGAWLLSSVRKAVPIARLDDHELPIDRELTDRMNHVIAGGK